MSVVDNERVKLTANWLNAISAGVIVTGVVAPIVVLIYRFQAGTRVGVLVLSLSSFVWIAIGTGLDFMARWLLKRLRP